MRWCGIDPGDTTGIAFWDDDQESLLYVEQVDSWALFADHRGQMWGADPHLSLAVEQLVRLIVEYQPDVIVIEEFTLRLPASSSDRSGLSPVRVISMLDVWLTEVLVADEGTEVAEWMQGVLEGGGLRFQQPSEKSVMTDARLRKRGWWITPKSGKTASGSGGGGPHVRDAARHIAVAYRKEHSLGKVRKPSRAGKRRKGR